MAKEITSVSHNSLAAGTTIKGEIITDNDIRIDGRVEGNIDCKGKVVIGQPGNIVGNIVCANAEIIGTLTGNLKTYEVLTIQATGRLKGDIQTKILVIEPNAVFNGSCLMGGGEKEKK
jgi:cytoskeletal protein CcmA (bactofilin family)